LPRAARSKLELAVDNALAALYPNEPIKHEVPIKVKGRTLFIDRMLKGPAIVIEVDGKQHDVFSEFHHQDAEGFKDSKARDLMKEQWAIGNGYTFVRIKHNETITTKTLRAKILEALHGQS
jgi:very-short-patch-repair endonuclease